MGETVGGGASRRGANEQQTVLVVTTTIDEMIPQDHPIRRIKPVVDQVLLHLRPKLNEMYSKRGRPSVGPGAAAEGERADGAVFSEERAMFSANSSDSTCCSSGSST